MATSNKRGDRPVSSVDTTGCDARAELPRRSDAVVNRARILAAAELAFAETGVGASLDEIARRAGVGAGTVHRHFPTKDALIDATIARGVCDLAHEAKRLTRATE